MHPSIGADDALVRALERYEPLIEASPLGVAVVDLDGRYRRVNEALCDLLERSEDEMMALRWQDVAHPDDIAKDERWIDSAEHPTLEHYHVERRYLLPSGEPVWVLLGVTVLEEEGEPIGFLSVVADITDRKEAEAALEREAVMVRVLKDVAVASNEAATIEDAMLRTVELVCAHTGWPVGHAYRVGDRLLVPTEIWHLEDPEAFRRFVEVTQSFTFAVGQGLPGQAMARRRPVWIQDASSDPGFLRGRQATDIGVRAGFAFPLMIDAEIVGVLEFFSREAMRPDAELLDLVAHVGTQLGRVVERQRAAEATAAALAREQEAAERLRALDDMKNTFLSAVSHDLRTPLSSVLGFASLLRENWDELDREQRLEFVELIQRGATKLDGLLGDLLDIERIKGGVAEAVRARVDLAAVVRRVAEESPLWAEGRLLVVAPSTTASVEASKIERVIENLVSNAAKYTPRGTPVWVRLHAEGRDVVLVVEDAGPGVSEQLRGTVFDPFTREAGTAVPGTGIGLTLVARFAELHGGSATVEDRPGGGARFIVRLPGALAAGESKLA